MSLSRGAGLLLVALAACARPDSGKTLPYRDSQLPLEQRVQDLLGRMTLEEKFWQLFMIPAALDDSLDQYRQGIFGLQLRPRGDPTVTPPEVAARINAIQRYFAEKTRLGIPIIPFEEALHGLVQAGATSFPQAIGLAATWDTALVGQVAGAIAQETRSRGIRQVLSPVLNVATDVRWGRVEETYGEDPFLVTSMGLAFIRPFERAGIVTTPKHFVANVGEGGRDSYPIDRSRRQLEEIDFPPFAAAIERGGARSVMASYNSVGGSPASASRWLLTEMLKGEWGFRGFVVSDAGGTGGANVLHFTSPDYAASARNALEAGLDVVFQSSYDSYPLFWPAFQKGLISSRVIDSAVARVLRAKFELGLFDAPYVDTAAAGQVDGSAEHRALALDAARASITLLKNEGRVLPISRSARSIAVIGLDAVEARLGGYSGPGVKRISMLDGIRAKVGASVDVRYAPGPGRGTPEYVPVPTTNLSSTSGGQTVAGLSAEYFDNIRLEGQPRLTRTDRQVDFAWTLLPPDSTIPLDWYSVRWTGKLIGPATGTLQLGVEGNDGYRLYLDGRLLIDNWRKQSHRTVMREVRLEQGRAYDLRLEYFETTGNGRVRLVWNFGIVPEWKRKIDDAVALARRSDVTVVVAGIEEGEFRDRASLRLPGHQEELIQAVAAAGKPVVVILVGGSAITMATWLDRAPAVLDAWYPGEVGGTAVADVLFGDYNPAGRLPITFPMSEGQLPLVYNHKPTGRGDDYLDLTGQPLFPFGFGLSYSTFEYSGLTITPATIGAGDSAVVRCRVKNTGPLAGDEVVQLYLRDVLASVVRPVMVLAGFARIHLEVGEEKEVAFTLSREQLSLLDRDLRRVVEPGEFRVMVGGSSRDIRLRGMLTVR